MPAVTVDNPLVLPRIARPDAAANVTDAICDAISGIRTRAAA